MRKHFKFQPKQGIIFNDLQIKIISSRIIRKLNNIYFDVQCLSCGKIYQKPQHSFFGKRVTKCQCHKITSSGYKGYEDISSVYYNRIKSGAESRDLEFNITKEQMWEKYLEQNRKCALSGLSIFISRNMRKRDKMTASLDRIDSSIGYINTNIQWVHKDVNKMKMNFSEEYFLKICKLIVKNDKSKRKNRK